MTQSRIWVIALIQTHLNFIAVNEDDGLCCYFWDEDLGEVEDTVRAEAGWVRGLLSDSLGHRSIACSDNQFGGAGILQHGDQNGTQHGIITPVITMFLITEVFPKKQIIPKWIFCY